MNSTKAKIPLTFVNRIFDFGGGWWIRTTEGIASRFTVCPLWPLGKSPKYNMQFKYRWSWWTDSNPRPADYKSAALPTELHQHDTGSNIIANSAGFVNKNFNYFILCDIREETNENQRTFRGIPRQRNAVPGQNKRAEP